MYCEESMDNLLILLRNPAILAGKWGKTAICVERFGVLGSRLRRKSGWDSRVNIHTNPIASNQSRIKSAREKHFPPAFILRTNRFLNQSPTMALVELAPILVAPAAIIARA